MPNYKYACNKRDCDYFCVMDLPISFDPKIKFQCDKCATPKSLSRRISASQVPRNTTAVYAGDWYKETYGEEIGQKDLEHADQQRALERERKELSKGYGIAFNEAAKPPGPKD